LQALRFAWLFPPSWARRTPNLLGCAITTVSRAKSVVPQVEIKSMALRARVGRHTQAGGRHCQNWADDQRTVVDLLNRIPTANGGAGGGLRPRVIAGIASDELYAAIVAFETKNFPGQRLGFFEPGGPMFRRLEVLGTPAPAPPAPAPAAPPPPAAPTTGPIPRPLTAGEKRLLFPIFDNTIDYDKQIVGRNDGKTGGEYNSFTPGYVPNMSPHLWSWDYSAASRENAAVFVHEMVHVWQSGHGSHNILRGIYLWIKYDHITSDYENSYKYDLDSSTSLGYFNMEQQAQIIEDYYRVFKGLPPEKNVGTRKSEADYLPYVVQLKAAGAFRWPPTSPRVVNSLERPL